MKDVSEVTSSVTLFGETLAMPLVLAPVGFAGMFARRGEVQAARAAAAAGIPFFSQAWEWINANFDPSVTWEDLKFIRANWSGRIILKGLMSEADARLAVDHGLDGIVVSNHGDRQLDGSPSSISVLPEIARCVNGQMPVLMDGGVRSGLDVLRAIQLGADACLIGRPWAFALAAGGETGVARMLSMLQNELRTAQTLSGKLTATP